jgi:hypothetical protein
MPLAFDLETTAITLPLDTVLEMLELIQKSDQRLPEETEGLLKVEVASVLSYMESVEEEVLKAIFKRAFGGP